MGPSASTTSPSPFHSGEQRVQQRAGVRESIEEIGQIAIRDYMPDQHREFFAQLPFIVVGSVDEDGWPWASMLHGSEGFISSPDARKLEIRAMPVSGDPLADGIGEGRRLGMLGIELPTRRRNRVNVQVSALTDAGLSLTVDQSFGNCPQYIQRRKIEIAEQRPTQKALSVSRFGELDEDARQLITRADTFFVASYVEEVSGDPATGADVSHRGGKAGFVRVEDNTLTIPDYAGNNFFNTLGNLSVNPRAGLLFPDFESGELLLLTGRVEILWQDAPQVAAFQGAERAWRFTLDHGVRITAALPFQGVFEDYSPTSLATGDWAQADAALAASVKRDQWQQFRVVEVVEESSVIRSFKLKPVDSGPLLPFEAGQFLTLRITPADADSSVCRTYTVSSAPGDRYYRVSVKRETDGLVSNYLHTAVTQGDVIEVKAPRGNFSIDVMESRPAVLLAGGVGITPMISMARHVAAQTNHQRALTVFHSAQDTRQRAFASEFRELAENTDGAIRYFSFINRATPADREGIDYDGTGYITADVLRHNLPLDDYDFYLCGPPAFMQSVYNTLRGLGVRDARVHAEAFGPAALTRSPDEAAVPVIQPAEAEHASIRFSVSGIETSWQRNGASILEVAEAQGVQPDYGCRNGSCGTCSTKVTQGTVTYRSIPTAAIAEGEALICCAVPAEGSDELVLEL